MSDGNDRSQKRPPSGGYAMNPYYYQHYYAAAVPNGGYAGQGMMGQQAMYPVVDPTQPGGYRWVYHPGYVTPTTAGAAGAHQSPSANAAMAAAAAYYYPYHAAYAAQYHQQAAAAAAQAANQQLSQSAHPSAHPSANQTPQASSSSNSSSSSSSSSLISSPSTERTSPPPPPSVPQVTTTETDNGASSSRPPISRSVSRPTERTTSVSSGVPEPLLLIRKTSKGYTRDNSKWRLSRSGSRASLGVADGSEDEELINLPASPPMGGKPGLSVSPRHCGSEFLPEPAEDMRPKYSKPDMHLVDAIRVVSGEIRGPVTGGDLDDRLEKLREILSLDLPLVSPGNGEDREQEVVGLLNPMNSKICYLNSVVQILVPITPLMQVMSLSLSHVTGGAEKTMPWTMALARAFRLVFNPPMGAHASLLTAAGMDKCISDLGGIGTQQDVAEALCIVLDRLHEEWKHVLVSRPWDSASNSATPSTGGALGEDSVIYKIFRGIKRFEKPDQLEIFTTIHLAPPRAGSEQVTLTDLLVQSFSPKGAGLLHYLPPVLCIELSRHLSENQLTTSQSSVPFSGTLVVPESCCTAESNVGGRKYELMGVVVRSGVYANSGHFWVAQRRGNKWYWINDTEVSECSSVSREDQEDPERNSISRKLDASSNWCVLVYADVGSKISIHP